jgi:predicted molibdopterin-dependent oxidoreductase YjgC
MLSAYPNSEILEKIHEYNNTFPPIEIDSIKDTDTILIIGSNGSVSHPIIENRIRKAYRNGTKIIFANSYDNRTSSFSHNTLIFNNGGELLLLHTILSGLLRNKNGEETKNLKLQLKKLDFNSACNQLGISGSQVNSAVNLISDSKKLLILAGDGILRGSNCIDSFNALFNLQLIQKNPDNCRIMFLLSEGNYYGGIFAGMNPGLLPGFARIDNKKSLKKWSDHLKIKLNNTPGLSRNEMTNNIGKDGIESLFVFGDIPGNPDLSGLKFFVQQNMFLTGISKICTCLLPHNKFP